MFCTKCGTKNEDGVKFCVQCGNKMEGAAPRIKPVSVRKEPAARERIRRERPALSDLKPKEKIKVFPIILFVVLLAAVIVFPKFILSGNEEEKVVKGFIDAEMTGDTEKLLSFIPDKIIEEMMNELNMSRSEVVDTLDEKMSGAQETINNALGENWSYSCKINNIQAVEGAAFNDIVDDYADIVDNLGISEATTVNTEVSVSGKDVDNSVELEIPLIKIDEKWYLDFGHIDLSSFGMESLF